MINRRNRVDLYSEAELAIRNATLEVEKIGADIRLTNAVILLGKAKDLVADYIDETLKLKEQTIAMRSSISDDFSIAYDLEDDQS
jgi:hypothetical protein